MRRQFIKRPVLASIQGSTIRFEVGKKYRAAMLYGGSCTYEVVDRTSDTVTLVESHVSEDDWSTATAEPEVYSIELHDIYDRSYENVIGQSEAVCIWEYHGHNGYLYAGGNH